MHRWETREIYEYLLCIFTYFSLNKYELSQKQTKGFFQDWIMLRLQFGWALYFMHIASNIPLVIMGLHKNEWHIVSTCLGIYYSYHTSIWISEIYNEYWPKCRLATLTTNILCIYKRKLLPFLLWTVKISASIQRLNPSIDTWELVWNTSERLGCWSEPSCDVTSKERSWNQFTHLPGKAAECNLVAFFLVQLWTCFNTNLKRMSNRSVFMYDHSICYKAVRLVL